MPALLTTTVAAPVAANTPFEFVVPGQYIWQLLAVRATLARAVGGTPTRALQLTITDGTNVVVASPAVDAGTEPGTLIVTWCDASASAVASGADGATLGPLGPLTLPAGYTITGSVINGAAADQWTDAVAWYTFTMTGPR